MTKSNSSSKRKTNIEMQEEKELKLLEEKKATKNTLIEKETKYIELL